MHPVKFTTSAALLAALSSGPFPEGGFRWVNPLPPDAHERLEHGTFRSPSMGHEVGYVVYLPPGYREPTNQKLRYPVVYWLHGGRYGSETRNISLAGEFDKRILAGIVPPRIYVFVNGGALSHYDHGDSLGETAFVKELIPHIDRTYRTIATRSGRAIEGFSAGGRGTARLMFKHPDLFCSAAPMGGGHQHEKNASENNGRVTIGTTTTVLEDPGDNSWDLARAYAEAGKNPPLHILVVVGTRDMNYQANLEWMEHLRSLGIPFDKLILEGVPHDGNRAYEQAGDAIMEFHERCFATASAEGQAGSCSGVDCEDQ